MKQCSFFLFEEEDVIEAECVLNLSCVSYKSCEFQVCSIETSAYLLRETIKQRQFLKS